MNEVLFNALQRVAKVVAPPPQQTISQWANSSLYLSPEDSAEQGKYTTARAPYQVGILDAFNEENAEEIHPYLQVEVGHYADDKAQHECEESEGYGPDGKWQAIPAEV